MTPSAQRDLIELWLLVGEGTADDAQLAQLSAWLEFDGDARVCVLDVARQQGWLAWNAGAMRLPAALAALADFDHQGKVHLTRTPGREPAAHSHSRSRWVWAALAASVL